MIVTEIQQMIIPNTKEGAEVAADIENKFKSQGILQGRSDGANEIIVTGVCYFHVVEAGNEDNN